MAPRRATPRTTDRQSFRVPRIDPETGPARLASGSGIHGAAAFFSRGVAEGAVPSVADVQGLFETMWNHAGTHVEAPRTGEAGLTVRP